MRVQQNIRSLSGNRRGIKNLASVQSLYGAVQTFVFQKFMHPVDRAVDRFHIFRNRLAADQFFQQIQIQHKRLLVFSGYFNLPVRFFQ